jgi:uncharacterized damage-inducible protein DinB
VIDQLRRLFDHQAWSDERVLAGLRSDPGTDAAALDYFAHAVAVEHVWMARIRQRPAEFAIWPRLSLDECDALAKRNREEYETLLNGLTPGDLARGIAYRNSAGVSFESRLEDILLHTMLHGAYHRGQVSLMVRRSGGTPSPTDYIAFIRGVPAATTQRD